MKRRSFLKSVLALVALPALPTLASSTKPSAPDFIANYIPGKGTLITFQKGPLIGCERTSWLGVGRIETGFIGSDGSYAVTHSKVISNPTYVKNKEIKNDN